MAESWNYKRQLSEQIRMQTEEWLAKGNRIKYVKTEENRFWREGPPRSRADQVAFAKTFLNKAR